VLCLHIEFKPNFENFVDKALRQRHLDSHCYKLLEQYLAQNSLERESIKNKIKALEHEILQDIERRNNKNTLSVGEANVLVQALLLKLIEEPVNFEAPLSDRYEEHRSILSKIISKMEKCAVLRQRVFKHET